MVTYSRVDQDWAENDLKASAASFFTVESYWDNSILNLDSGSRCLETGSAFLIQN